VSSRVESILGEESLLAVLDLGSATNCRISSQNIAKG
jgi:hypothetical protein